MRYLQNLGLMRMQSPEEFIEGFFHARDYDPAARREYYLKTRKLKGRRVGSSNTAIARHPSSGSASVKRPLPSAPKKSASERRKAIEARVAALQARLDKLQKILTELVRQAKLRSGVETPKKDTANDKPEKLTTKQKADAAERAKDFYEKNKDPKLSEQAKALEAKIKSVQAKIKQMRSQLAAVRSRELKRKSDSVGPGTRIQSRKGNSR